MNSNSESIEQVILPEIIEMETIVPSRDDVIIGENDDMVRILNEPNNSTNPNVENSEPVRASESVETVAMQSPNDNTMNLNIDESSLKRLMSEIDAKFAVKFADFSKKTDEKMSNLEERFHNGMDELKEELNETKGDICELVDRVDDVVDSTFANDMLRNQALLRYNIVLLGVPSNDNENNEKLRDILLAIANTKSVNLSARNICEIFRVNGREKSPIVVKFNSFDAKQAFLKIGKSILWKDVFKSSPIQEANEKILIRNDYTHHFRKLLKIAFEAVGAGRLKWAWLTESGLTLQFLNGSKRSSIIFEEDLESIINALPEPGKKPRRQRRRGHSARAKQLKRLQRGNDGRRGHQGRNKNHLNRQNHGIMRTKRFLIIFLSFFRYE